MNVTKTPGSTLSSVHRSPATPDPYPEPAAQTSFPVTAALLSRLRGISSLRAPKDTPLAVGHALGAPPLPLDPTPLPAGPRTPNDPSAGPGARPTESGPG